MSIKLKAKLKGDRVEFKALINHPMETGQRKNSQSGELIPAHYINEVLITANDKPVMKTYWGPSVSKNPYIAFQYAGAKGDTLKLSWTDNKGESDSAETEVK